jgi:hypothetical protein
MNRQSIQVHHTLTGNFEKKQVLQFLSSNQIRRNSVCNEFFKSKYQLQKKTWKIKVARVEVKRSRVMTF